MPLQNRVTPGGEIEAVSARGLMMGNRGGAFHGADQRLGQRRWASKQWICCVLEFKGRHRELMQPGRYTELFFLDEATALAAGHRPCFECRREAATRFAVLWGLATVTGRRTPAPDLDQKLHDERVAANGQKRVHRLSWSVLPPGTFVRHGGRSWLNYGGRLLAWSHFGYEDATALPEAGMADVLTPPAIVAVLAEGYAPLVHPSADAGAVGDGKWDQKRGLSSA